MYITLLLVKEILIYICMPQTLYVEGGRKRRGVVPYVLKRIKITLIFYNRRGFFIAEGIQEYIRNSLYILMASAHQSLIYLLYYKTQTLLF